MSLDRAAIQAQGRATILAGDGSDGVFFLAMRAAQRALEQGHQSVYLEDFACDSEQMPIQNTSRLGVCGRVRGDAIVVTFAQPNNPLGLQAGDLVSAVDAVSGPALLEYAAARPVCGVVSPSASGTRASAAASFFGTVPTGAQLTVQPVRGGAPTTVEVPAGNGEWISCQDALGRDLNFNAEATLRPDGIAVIRLPRFYPIDAMLPPNPTQQDYEEFIANFQAAILAEFDTVKQAPGLVWDARGNYGGISLVGLAIAGGMPSAAPTAISYCTSRIPQSEPPAFSDEPYAIYDVTPGGPFAYAGKVAVIVDGLDYSAADYFPYAIRKATATPLVGEASAGAYGGTGGLLELEGPPGMFFNYDVNRCVDADTNEPLEGTAVEPDLPLEYDPEDLAAGVDTLLEAAVLLVQ
jgi:C-terminal processing protease CtpA/Prc